MRHPQTGYLGVLVLAGNNMITPPIFLEIWGSICLEGM